MGKITAYSLIFVLVSTFTFEVAHAQNALGNPGFEDNPPPSLGNNIGYSIAPWQVGSGDQPNVVKVDGPGGYDYGSAGPESDASAPGSIPQHYLDIANGSNDFYQSFTPACSGNIDFGGSFSTRANEKGTGSITLYDGDVKTGTIIGSTNKVFLLGGNSQFDPWVTPSFSAQITAGTMYTFVVDMDNNMNFDNGFVNYQTVCESDPTVPIPTLGTTALLVLVMSLLGIGFLSKRLRQQKTTQPYK